VIGASGDQRIVKERSSLFSVIFIERCRKASKANGLKKRTSNFDGKVQGERRKDVAYEQQDKQYGDR
jgi:hypothetical protein